MLLNKKEELKREVNDLSKTNLKEISVDELVGSYREIRDIKDLIDSCRKDIKKIIIEHMDINKNWNDVEHKYDNEENVVIGLDDNNNRFLEAFDERVKAVKMTRKRLNKDKTEEELKEKGLWSNVVEKEGKIDNPDAYLTIIEDVMNYLEKKLEEDSDALELYEKMDDLIDIEVEEKINEDKLEALEELDFIDNVDRFYNVTEYYNLYASKIEKEGGE